MPSVFICHASEDKDAIARPLANALRERHVEVWFDEFSLKVGDSLREQIDRGLARSDFGIVIVSPDFFAKRWPQREMNGLVSREMAGTSSIVLPVWHNVDRDFILSQSPPLADVVAANSGAGLQAVVEKLLKTIRPTESPLVIARERLSELGFSSPSVADDWWLDIAEIKQSQLADPDCCQRWIFPLPFSDERNGRERGLNLASTVLQLDWCHEAEDLGFCQLTHPDELHAFFREKGGMLETVRRCPGTLAMYAPQLTIPGFDAGLEDVFDALLEPTRKDAYEMPGYSGWETVDGKAPSCGELIAWRHSEFGRLTSRHLAYSFVNSHDHHYTRRCHSTFDCLTWLLSSESNWLPARISDTLLDGFQSRGLWFQNIYNQNNGLAAAMYNHRRKGFKVTRSVRAGAEELFALAVSRLRIKDSPSAIANRFFQARFVEEWYIEQEEIRASRSVRSKPVAP